MVMNSARNLSFIFRIAPKKRTTSDWHSETVLGWNGLLDERTKGEKSGHETQNHSRALH
jgi:hypothetical protein